MSKQYGGSTRLGITAENPKKKKCPLCLQYVLIDHMNTHVKKCGVAIKDDLSEIEDNELKPSKTFHLEDMTPITKIANPVSELPIDIS